MQDKYVGDVGDFGKYILLNEICKESKLGVNWFYVTKEKKKAGDKEYRYRYLRDENKNSKEYERCFPEIYKKLRGLRIAENKNRTIAKIKEVGILPKEIILYGAPFPDPSELEPSQRKAEREKWFEESLGKFREEKVDIIFLDPDNGIQLNNDIREQKRAIKYVFKDEIEQYCKLGKSLIIYNHRDRSPNEKYNAKIFSIKDSVKSCNSMRVLRFKRFYVRDYVFLIQGNHQEVINKTIERLCKDPYDFLFEKYNPDRVN